ncbi:MAG: ABC transporter ATP-binding protein [Treponema sp.]|nr:ABC transporter ATP-binding protein [Treponema sp.]
MKNFFKIFKILTPKQMRICSLIIVLMFIVSVMEAFGIGLLYPLISIIGDPQFLEKHENIAKIVGNIGIDNHRKLICFSSLMLLAFYILKNFLVLLQGKIQISFSSKNQADYTKRLYSYYMKKNYLYHVNTNPAILGRNIGNGGSVVFSEILVYTFQVITNLITCFVIGIFIAIMDWFIALCVLIIIAPVIYLLLNYFRKKIGKAGDLQNRLNAENTKWFNQGFYSIKETKVMQQEDFFIDKYSESYTKYTKSTSDYLYVQRFPKSIIEMVTIGGILLLIAVKMIFTNDAQSLIPTLGVLALAAVRLMPCLNQTISMINNIKFKMPLFNEIFDDLLAVRNNKDLDERKMNVITKSHLDFQHSIQVENLSFSYPSKNEKVFDGISFSIPKGSFVGIVGPSGAGKTTFVDILLGLLTPTSGTILVDGQDISKNIGGWLDNVSYVPQSIYLIDGTIRENITFGIPSDQVCMERLQTALKMSELYDFVQSLPEKENTKVGDRGSRLSGGQKQRIGIARALYRNPNVLVLDEATSALDNQTEKQITNTILKLKGKITIISIAHRVSTLEDCDFKVNFEKGKVTVEKNES